MKKPLYQFTLLLSLILTSTFSWSQQKEYIVGSLIDAITTEPVAFATIRIKGKALGVISNIDGGFKIPMRFKISGDTLLISSMGYEPKELLIKELSASKKHTIRMKPGVFDLTEVVVRAKKKRKSRGSARQIVRRAIKEIPNNYASKPFALIGYYRDYQSNDTQYMNLNEAILEVFDPGFFQLDDANTKIRIYDYKQNLDFERDSLSASSYDYTNYRKTIRNAFLSSFGGNEFTILRAHDAIRNYKVNSYDYVNNIEEDLFKNHQFYKEDDTYIDGEMLYTVQIQKIKNGYRLQGKFYISKATYAIYKMEYAVYDLSKPKTKAARKKQENNDQLLYEVTTAYTPENSKMYLNYISLYNSFLLKKPPEFTVKEVVVNRFSNCFEVRFTKDVDPKSAGRKRNYKFKYQGKRIRFREVVVFDNAVRLFPELPKAEIDSMFNKVASAFKKKRMTKELFVTKISKIKSRGLAETHFLNESKLVNYQQFREFFVQQVKLIPGTPIDSLMMNKRKPIFKDQPIVRPDNFDDYWMNTPLKPAKN